MLYNSENTENLTSAKWRITGYDGMKIVVTYKEDMFRIHMDNGAEQREQTYAIYTKNELTRRVNFLEQGKNPCGKWNDRNGKRICFENATPI